MIFQKIFSFLALLTLLSTLSSFIFFGFFSDKGGISAKDEAGIAAFINKEYTPGDIIFSTPVWDVGFTKYLDEKVTGVSFTLSNQNLDDLKHELSDPENSIFFILESKSKWDEMNKKLNFSAEKIESIGAKTLVKARPTGVLRKKVFDFVDNILNAQSVFMTDSAGRKPCSVENNRWQCSEKSWNYIGEHHSLMGSRWQKALWAHPVAMKKIHVVFPNKENSNLLIFGSAFLPRALNEKNGAPVEVEIFADGKSIYSYKNYNIKKYYKNEISLPENSQTIEITIFAENDGARHFVFNGYLAKK